MSSPTCFSPEMEMFRADNFLAINKTSIKIFGLVNACYLANLVDKDIYFREHKNSNGEFFLKEEQQTEQLGLSSHQIRNSRNEYPYHHLLY